MTTRRFVLVAVVAVVSVAIGLLFYAWLRVPPQRSGDGWRVIAQVPTPYDETQARLLPQLPESVPSDKRLRANESALQVLIGGGECDHLRITDVERAEDTIQLSVGRYVGVRDRFNGCNDVGKIESYVLGLSPELAQGARYLSVDNIDAILITS